jgi:uncharacterized protein (TIGR03067 family)
MRRTIAAVAVLAAGVALAQTGGDPATELKKLEGAWEVREGTIGGKPADATEVVIKDGLIRIHSESRDEPKFIRDDEAKFAIDPSKSPAHLNLTTVRGNLAIAGIYEFRDTQAGVELVIAFTQGDGGARPKDFSGTGERTVLLKLVRKKPVRD